MDTSRSPLEPSGFSRKLAATIIIVYMVVTLIPITWIVATSFKSVDSAISYPPEVFFEPSLEGYVNLFTNRSRQPQEYLDSLPPCLLYTSPSPRDKRQSRMPSSA